MDKKVYLETLGCSKNRVDSEIMLGSLNKQGYQFTDDAEEAEVIIVNTCGFLSAASQESITRILELSDLKQEGRCEKLVAAAAATSFSQRPSCFKSLNSRILVIDSWLAALKNPQVLTMMTSASSASSVNW